MKLTASKVSLHALARGDSGERRPRGGGLDLGAFGGVSFVFVGGAVVAGKAISSSNRKSGKKESRDDFYLHIVLFFCCKAER